MNRGDKAKEYFNNGYNCSQSVFLAFNDLMNLDEDTVIKLSAGFGGGFGRMREVCGSVCGMTAVISFFNACDDPNNIEKKKELYSKIQSAMKEFSEINGSYICKELLGKMAETDPSPTPRTEAYYHKRSCGDFCKAAAEIAEKYI